MGNEVIGDWFSRPVNCFQDRNLPVKGVPVGYAALIHHYQLSGPLPPRLTAVAEGYHAASTEDWQMLTPRHRPIDSLAGQLVFALKAEGIDLASLAALFKVVQAREIEELVRETPTGAFARRIWFLYEWLTGRELDVAEPGKVRFVDVVNTKQQVALTRGMPSARHKVFDNLPGTRRFCPLVRWTGKLKATSALGLNLRALKIISRTPKDLIARAAAFLLLSDSKSSFAIEGERPSSARAARWARAIADAGVNPVTLDELERLQRVVIGDDRFVKLGLRQEGGFIGLHDRDTREPVPDHISARAQDLPDLLTGLVEFDRRTTTGMDPVVAAASLAFGFVYIHPFVDGNGRLHRWLIHHVLAAAGYNPPGVVFPISACILRRMDEYRALLESYSAPLLPFIEWRATPEGNVDVRNDTAVYYRFFDATAHAEFLYSCVEQTIAHDLPDEVRFLESFDKFARAVKEIVEMPDQRIELLQVFLSQAGGTFSKRARRKEFAALTDKEVSTIEALHKRFFQAPGVRAL